MKLTLEQGELEEAIRKYVGGLINVTNDADMSVVWKAGRGDNGMSVELDIRYLGVRKIDLGSTNQIAGTPIRQPEQEKAEEENRHTSTPMTPSPTNIPIPEGVKVLEDGSVIGPDGKKLDGRSAEVKAIKKSLFGGIPAPKALAEGEKPKDHIDTAVEAFTKDPEPKVDTPVLKAAEEALGPVEEPGEVQHPTSEQEEEMAPPPASTTPRKSLFSNFLNR